MKKIIIFLSLIYFISCKDCWTWEPKNSQECFDKDTDETLCCYFEGKVKIVGLKRKACYPIPRMQTDRNAIISTVAEALQLTIETYICEGNFQKIGLFLFMILFIL